MMKLYYVVFVTIFTEWMSNKTKVIMETFGICVGLLVFSVFTVATFQDFYQAFEAGAYMDGDLELPESPARCSRGFPRFAHGRTYL